MAKKLTKQDLIARLLLVGFVEAPYAGEVAMAAYELLVGEKKVRVVFDRYGTIAISERVHDPFYPLARDEFNNNTAAWAAIEKRLVEL